LDIRADNTRARRKPLDFADFLPLKGINMRKLLAALLICLPVSAFAATPQTTVLDVQNMTCSMCSITIHKALEKVPGVIEATVDYDHKTATVRYDADKTNPSALVKATTNAGFPSTLHGGGQK
jgi:periplasmic mercuric ion binding protein